MTVTRADGQPQKPGHDAPVRADVQVKPGAVRPGVDAPLPAAPAATKRPGVSFERDAVDRKNAGDRSGVGAARGDLTRPFLNYDLPDHDGQVPGQRPVETAEMHRATALTVNDLVQRIFDRQTAGWLTDRAGYLTANPADSVFHQLVGAEFRTVFAAACQEHLKPNAALREAMAQRFGPAALHFCDAAREGALQASLGNGVLREQVPSETIAAGMLSSFLARGGRADGVDPKAVVSQRAAFLTGPGGAVDPKILGEIGARVGTMIFDASPSYYILLAAELVKGDVGKDLDLMGSALTALKEEAKGIIAEILRKEGGILGIQMSSAEAAGKAKQAADCAHMWQSIGTVIGLIVSIVTSVVATVLSFGTLAPGASMLLSAATHFPAMVAVASVASTVTMFIQTLPELVVLVGGLCRNLGLADAARDLDAAAEDIKDWYKDNPWFTDAVMIIQIASAVFMLAYSIATLPLTGGASVAAQAKAIGVIIALASAAATLASGAVQVIGAYYQKELAKMELAIEMLRAQLALVEAEIKELMHAVHEAQTAQREVIDDIEEKQDQEQRLSESFNKAADAFGDLLKAIAI
ncbi:MAG: hypothetical protein IT381_13775 [Deltaproteobacteria bacterium]|nr:hypothetical protein [Deltaproteobacteria bacterium]